MDPYFLNCIFSRRERKGGVIRPLILTLAILAIIGSAHSAKAGMSSTPREWSVPGDTAIATSEATQQTEEQIGLTKAKRRNVQRRLTRLGFETKVNGTFDETTRAAISRWQEESGYPSTGFLNAGQHKALTDAAKQAAKSDRKDRRRAGNRTRYSRGGDGPIGAIGGVARGVGGAVRGVGRGVGSAVGGLFRR
jgi:peptidoglycan hydrolase-like protein with peptidoglycan-binding domain